MPQYRYKLARKIIKRTFHLKRRLLKIYDDEDFLICELRQHVIKTPRDEFITNCNGVIQEMQKVLSSPNRF